MKKQEAVAKERTQANLLPLSPHQTLSQWGLQKDGLGWLVGGRGRVPWSFRTQSMVSPGASLASLGHLLEMQVLGAPLQMMNLNLHFNKPPR